MRSRSLIEGQHLPLLIEPEDARAATAAALGAWIAAQRAWIDDRLCEHGGLLFRGFALVTVADFEAVCPLLGPELRSYVGGDSPRSEVAGKIYNSTEFPPDLQIELHNELSYGAWWPSRIYFFCRTPAARGGETHIADSREILRRLDPGIRARFAERGLRYIQNLRDAEVPGAGKSWQETFETEDRAEVETFCRAAGMEWRWTGNGLTTAIRRPGVLDHPATGEAVWFNQADQWHSALAGVKHQEGSQGQETPEIDPPCHATYGDGGAIDPADLTAVRRVYGDCEVLFSWRRGDLLVLDNLLAAHGRKPFEGDREILVAMA
jgi:alpha-ketoglutarate-dependent taurine dioxygenase